MMRKVYTVVVILLVGLSCREPFFPEGEFGETNYLVVEGYINIGEGMTRIRLSRTRPLDQTGQQLFELGAIVSVEGDDNSKVELIEKGNGAYEGDLHLPSTGSYRVRIKVTGGKEYVSDLASPKITPEIDSVTWRYDSSGVSIALNTHDITGGTRYYQLEFEETWEIRSFFISILKYQKPDLIYRPEDEIAAMYRCWKSRVSPDLTLYSSAMQTQDVILNYPIAFIPEGAEELSNRYSIIVRQHSLTREAYEYLTLMKKNTGPLGSFTDPQPAELNGNIHCTTSDEPVIGYVGAFTTEESRIFINRWEVPSWRFVVDCVPVFTLNHPDTLAKYLSTAVDLPTEPIEVAPGGIILSLYRAYGNCVDCRRNGGHNNEPDYWN